MRKERRKDSTEGEMSGWHASSRKLGGNMPDEAAGFDEESLGWSAMWDLTALREAQPIPGNAAPFDPIEEAETADG